MADLIRARYKGKDTGDGLPHYGGVPARDLHDSDFDNLDNEQKELVRHSDLYTYVPYTEKPREGTAEKPAEPPKSGAEKEGAK